MKMVKLIVSTTLMLCLLLNTNTQAQTSNSMPSNVEDDRCYAEAASPTQFLIKKEDILIRQGFSRVINHEAVYDTVTYGVLAHAKTKAILAGLNFEVVGNAIKVGTDVRLINTNDEFEVRDEIQDAIVMKWDLSDIGMCDAPSTNDCDLIDWVEIPAEYIPMTQEQGKSTEGNNKLTNSVAYFDIKVRGNDQIIPVEYRFYTKEILAKAPTQEIVEVPAIYKTVTSQVQVNDNVAMEWVEIVCPAKIDGFLIGQIQLALKGRKYYHGRITGIWTEIVQNAIESYQIENGLPVGKLDKNTISSLGLNYEMIVNPNDLSTLTYISE